MTPNAIMELIRKREPDAKVIHSEDGSRYKVYVGPMRLLGRGPTLRQALLAAYQAVYVEGAKK